MGLGAYSLVSSKTGATSYSFWHPWYLVQGLVPVPTHHQCADLDLLVFGGLVDLFEQDTPLVMMKVAG